jgi:hypothetical protein
MRTFYEWINTTALSQFLQSSTYTFPVTEVFHLIGLTILLGCAVVVSLRLLGFGLKEPAWEIERGIAGWTWFGFALVWGTGIVLLIAEPIKLAGNVAFPYKIAFLLAGVVLHFYAFFFLLKPGRAEASPVTSKAVAVLTLVCWFGAGVAGRAIGFV